MLCLAALLAAVTAQVSCTYKGVDFSVLAATTDYTGADPTDSLNLYAMNVCANVNRYYCSDPNAVGYKYPNGIGVSCWGLGTIAEPTWSPIKDGVRATFSGAECSSTSGPAVSHFDFECATTERPSTSLLVETTATPCEYIIHFPTSLACDLGGDESGGLSGGSIFLIIFFVGTFLYCAGGVVYNQRQGVTGIEMVPNIQFWRELPGLVKDGCVFTKTKLTGGGYQSMA
eukprot:TRINITY_DN19122_c0_g1_i1.p2 TRINITY_DN19122_c0_g1~~TRINITY_DN19122_c0_g1_i1.p2  ORF type:complete len:229 (+),score=46.03 TRINITY_DN19122_c0_g1_i1:3-689(+)